VRRLVALFLGRGPRTAGGEQLGTFIGVFTPSILTILGVILFLRAGWVVGNAGLAGAIAIVLVAHAITIATALSVSAVATNMRVGAGGAYYIISRSLGVEVGAAIGIPLFLAQALSATLYAFGLAESLQQVWPDVPQGPVAAATILVISLIAARGAGLALRLQLPIMAAIVAALVVLFVGVVEQSTGSVDINGPRNGESFWTVFAVFFPAVTGILAGISLSGDLSRPDRSIPRGTLAAVLVGFVVYLAVVIGLAIGADQRDLMTDNLIWFTIAGGAAFLIFPGLWGAIFSSAVGSILGAPRTLAAMVDDRVLPRWVGASIGKVKGPGIPLVLSLAVSLGAVLLGDLDAVAPVLTMFFLTAYGMINLVAGVEALAADPSFRPTMRIPWAVSLAGALGCFWVMYLINPIALFAALVIEIGIYLLMRRRALAAPWGDLRRGAIMSLIRSSVIQLRRLPLDPRNWRPNILLFAGDIKRRPDLVRFGSWLVQDRGILTVCDLRVGTIDADADWLATRTQELNEHLAQMGLLAFGEVDIVEGFENGAVAVAQANGIAGIESNTVMFGWSDKAERQVSQLRIIERLALLGKSAVICRVGTAERRSRNRVIHVWWGGLQQNGDMLALFAHLISLNPAWRDSKIHIKSIATSEMMAERNTLLLNRMIQSARIRARVDILNKAADRTVSSIIKEHSADADVVLMGLRANDPGDEAEYAQRLERMMEGLPTVILVRNAGVFRGRLLGDDEATAAVDRT
jgi:amino acid transporter